jgi:HemY protein
LPAAEIEALAVSALEAELENDALEPKRLDELWMACPPAVRKAPSALAGYARGLQRLGQGDRAEKQLKQALKRRWHGALVDAYGQVTAEDRGKQLNQAEQWLKQHPEDAKLLLATARLCMASELWGKARSYLESSLALAPEPAAYALYGGLLDRLGETELAAAAYHSGLRLVSGIDSELPALGAPQLEDDAADAKRS